MVRLWHGVVQVWYGTVQLRYGIWYGRERYGIVWYGYVMVWNDIVWYGILCYAMVWYGAVLHCALRCGVVWLWYSIV